MSPAEESIPSHHSDLVESAPDFRRALIGWFIDHARELPWRATSNPYHIWLSEVILQQTRVDQAVPYYNRFVETYPTIEDLAHAPIDDVLRSWEGLGYYSRARNLHRAAKVVVARYNGLLPSSREDVLGLPGVGPYTAAAILSIAFGQAFGVVDGNVIRVLSRVLAFDGNVRQTSSKKMFQQLADDLVDPERPGDFNEAIMELGATVCLPRKPLCDRCPISTFCQAFGKNPEAFPRPIEKKAIPHFDIAVAILTNDHGEYYIQRRPETGLLGGLWEFPGGKREAGESIEEACRREVMEELGIEITVDDLVATIKHAYSHFRITLYAFNCSIVNRWNTSEIASGGNSKTAYGRTAMETARPRAWIAADRLTDYAFPRANRKLIDVLTESEGNASI